MVVTLLVFGLNGLLLRAAAADHSWGALGIAMYAGPVANGILLLFSLAFGPVVTAGAKGTAGRVCYYAAAGVLPVIAVPIDFFAIGSMNLHGC